MNPIVTGAEMRELDRLTIEDAGIAGIVLMENAGRQTAERVRDLWEEDGAEGPVLVVCGHGNNGGDGLVVARTLHCWGIEAHCVLVSPREKVLGDALTQLDIVDTLGISVVEVLEGWPEDADLLFGGAPVIVDAVLGTGLESEVRGRAAEAIARINASEAVVVSVDLPSGIHADTGQVMGDAVIADLTVTFGLKKRAHCLYPALLHCGRIELVDIGIPPEVVDHVAPIAFESDDLEAPFLPPRPPNAHKGNFGHVLVVGGSPGMAGAPLLSAYAALRAGAGLVTVLTDADCQPYLQARHLELMVGAGWSNEEVPVDGIVAACEARDVVVVGPGLAQTEAGAAVLEAVMSAAVPVVADAGALALLARYPELAEREAPLVLTPHPGEAGALLELTGEDVQKERFKVAMSLNQAYAPVVVLKGARSLVAGAFDGIAVNTTGNAGMATAGAGDVLAGIIGAFMCRFEEPFEAARAAVHVHGLCGDHAAAVMGEDGLVAGDLIAALPTVMLGERMPGERMPGDNEA